MTKKNVYESVTFFVLNYCNRFTVTFVTTRITVHLSQSHRCRDQSLKKPSASVQFVWRINLERLKETLWLPGHICLRFQPEHSLICRQPGQNSPSVPGVLTSSSSSSSSHRLSGAVENCRTWVFFFFAVVWLFTSFLSLCFSYTFIVTQSNVPQNRNIWYKIL